MTEAGGKTVGGVGERGRGVGKTAAGVGKVGGLGSASPVTTSSTTTSTTRPQMSRWRMESCTSRRTSRRSDEPDESTTTPVPTWPTKRKRSRSCARPRALTEPVHLRPRRTRRLRHVVGLPAPAAGAKGAADTAGKRAGIATRLAGAPRQDAAAARREDDRGAAMADERDDKGGVVAALPTDALRKLDSSC